MKIAGDHKLIYKASIYRHFKSRGIKISRVKVKHSLRLATFGLAGNKENYVVGFDFERVEKELFNVVVWKLSGAVMTPKRYSWMPNFKKDFIDAQRVNNKPLVMQNQ
jgi:hypothetical protein